MFDANKTRMIEIPYGKKKSQKKLHKGTDTVNIPISEIQLS